MRTYSRCPVISTKLIVISASVFSAVLDYSYLGTNALEVALELGCDKFPAPEELPRLWDDNREPLLAYMEQVHIGIKGFVRNNKGHAMPGATISVQGIQHDIITGMSSIC
ncbi:PREDICTED: carboxypeptidase E-like [Branchiostoma belcheri]|uniref:Carboxypeptidase E-like n=1 Tax=Branchiostoma belcheri TaxID=7741 RepID=A0A6P4Z5N3_BRABE|nr:PREDICTED: carboxypeptidase E-like [Branchiostoma belcheri]